MLKALSIMEEEFIQRLGYGIYEDDKRRSGESGEVGAVGFDGYNGSLTGGSSSTLGVNCGMTTGRTGIITTDEIPSGLLNQGDVQSKHIYSEDAVCGTLCSGTTEGMNIAPSVMCLNPDDPQSERVYDESGVWHSLNANSGGGQNRDAVMTSYGVTSKGNGDAFISEERHTALSTGGGEAGQGYPCIMQPDQEPIVLESNQNHATVTDSGVAPTLPASMGLGGGYVPMITQPTLCIDQGANKGQAAISEELSPTLTTTHGGTPVITDTIAIEGNGSRESHLGDGYRQSDQMYTLNTVEQHSVCYGISSYDSNAMKSANPNSGIYQADTARTLDLNGGNPACNQGGIAVVQSAGFLPGQGAKAEGIGYADEQSPTLRASQEVGVVYPDVARSLTARNDGSPCIDRGPDFVVQEQTECSGLTNRGFESGDVAETLRAESHGAIPMVVQNESAVFENHSQDSRFRGPLDVAQPVTATYGMGGNNQPLVVSDEPTAFAQQAFGEYKESDAASTVKSCDYKHETDLICAPSDPEAKFWDGTDVASTLTATDASGHQRMPDKQHFNAVIQPEPFAVDVRNGTENPDVNGTLQAKSNGGTSLNLNNIVRQKYIVRRLTVLECNRLQGFPEFDKVDVREMTKDEYIAWNLAEGNILTDPETGKVFATRGPGGVKLDEPVELKGSIVNGYRVVSIRNHDVKLQCRVHRVIWISVHGVLPDGYVIDHINNDKQDNRICNLQLLTPADNSHKAKADGRYKTGLESKTTKLDPELHEKIAYLYAISPLTQKQLGSLFGVSKSRIGQIVKKCAWVDIGDWYDENGKLHKDSDSAKYRALGNSIAIPPWLFVLGELNQYCDDKAMASLFSGIDGFPLIWSYLNGKENCVWSSEIEPYCVALSKKYFPDESETAAEQISE